jgi:cyanophycinase
VNWFRSLGARDVAVVPLTDRASAEDATVATELERARLIYLLGGFTHYLGQTLAGSASHLALRTAHAAGAVIAGSSAGAMVLCEHYYDPTEGQVRPGLGFVPRACVIPHHDTFGRGWAPRLAPALPDAVLVGVDEQTGMLDDGAGRVWRVAGAGAVTVYWQGDVQRYAAGETLELRLRP